MTSNPTPCALPLVLPLQRVLRGFSGQYQGEAGMPNTPLCTNLIRCGSGRESRSPASQRLCNLDVSNLRPEVAKKA